MSAKQQNQPAPQQDDAKTATELIELEKSENETRIAEESRAERLANVNKHRDEYRGGKPLYPFQVAPRRKLKSEHLRGELLSGAEVRPEWVGGERLLHKLVTEGLVIRRAG